ISQHRAAEGSDERCHHRVSQGWAPLSQNRKCERFWTLLDHCSAQGASACNICQLDALLSRNAAGVGEQSTRSIWSSNKMSAISSREKSDNSQVIFVFLVRPQRLRMPNSQHCLGRGGG